MKHRIFLPVTVCFACICLLLISTVHQAEPDNERESGYLRYPDIFGDRIVFTAEDDLWIVPAEGGVARRLTKAQGREAFAHFSPDGSWIGFSGHFDGNEDVYVVSADGGEPRRLTYHPDRDQVVEWSMDGEHKVV